MQTQNGKYNAPVVEFNSQLCTCVDKNFMIVLSHLQQSIVCIGRCADFWQFVSGALYNVQLTDTM